MRMLIGFLLGLLAVLILGAVAINENPEQNVRLTGAIATANLTPMFQSSFSGITPDGDCYLAITNTQTGRTEIFKLRKGLDKMFADKAFEKGRDGRVVAIP